MAINQARAAGEVRCLGAEERSNEPMRSGVDSYILDWITRQPLKREWSFEKRDGDCRFMAPFACLKVRLAVAPVVGTNEKPDRNNRDQTGP